AGDRYYQIERVFGSNFGDTMTGNGYLYGFAGNDTFIDASGNSTYIGGADNDLYVFHDNFGNDTIWGFEAKNNLEDIDLSNVSSITSWIDLSTPANGHMYQSGADVIIDDLAGNTITLKNVIIGDLDASDFIF
ncbi:MAG: hypothetical protein KDJ74_02965, partial [Notoacmeibacter sp.]|nr:hypothetical protein [Notoacmeibacter sp.]